MAKQKPPVLIGEPARPGLMTRGHLTIRQIRQAKRLGVLDNVLDALRLNEVCTCGEVPQSIECRAAHKPKKAKPAPRQPWETAA